MMNRQKFYNFIRSHMNITTQNVSGFEKVLTYAEERSIKLASLAYVLATAWWETAQTMWPVREAFWLSENWRMRNLRYWPFYGRGLIQTTWKANYEKMSNIVQADLVAQPDLLLEWPHALPALFVGMEKGLYTGKALGDFIDNVNESDSEDLREFINARRIVNGTDRATTIGKLAIVFEHALQHSGYDTLELTKPLIILALGSRGEDVRRLQELLGAPADSVFGRQTRSAVIEWQKNHALRADGIAGPKTLQAMGF